MAMRFENCYKILLDYFPFCIFNTFAPGSKWYDECQLSDDESLTLYTTTLLPNAKSSYIAGSPTVSTNLCTKVIPHMHPITSYVMDTVFSYLDLKFPDELE